VSKIEIKREFIPIYDKPDIDPKLLAELIPLIEAHRKELVQMIERAAFSMDTGTLMKAATVSSGVVRAPILEMPLPYLGTIASHDPCRYYWALFPGKPRKEGDDDAT
jgi:hypothetical protein